MRPLGSAFSVVDRPKSDGPGKKSDDAAAFRVIFG